METKLVKTRKKFGYLWFILVFLFILIVVPVAGFTMWVNWAFQPVDNNGKEVIFVIKENENALSIARRLKDAGLIKDINAFRLYTRFACNDFSFTNPFAILKSNPSEMCLSGNIQAGSFKLSPKMDLTQLSRSLTEGRLDSWIKILEGLRNEEIAGVLEKNYPINNEEFLKEAEIGYMFPDTYLFNVNSSAKQITQKMKETFDLRVTPEIKEGIQKQGLSLEEGVTMASIVERESRNDEERAVVAGILLKRLREDWRLEVDATIQFALGYEPESKLWWRKNLTFQDLNIDSPYNTRKFAGLPPGPICNPGLSSIKAVAQPVESDYYFYLHDPNGKIYYGRTLQEHNENKSKYLQ